MSNIRLQCVDGSNNPVFLVNNSGIVTASTAQLTNANMTTQTVGTSRVTTSIIATGNSNTIGSLISTGGNMGIGITSPGTRLDIRSTSDGTCALVAQFGGSSTPRIQLYEEGTDVNGYIGGKIYMNSTNVSIIEPSGSLSLIPRGVYNGADVNVGISTIDPRYTLDVNGTISIRQGNGANVFNANQLVLGWNNSNDYAHAIKTRHNAGGNDSNNAIDFYVWQTSNAQSAVGTKHKMSITSSGVGIDYVYPTAAVHAVSTSGNVNIIVDSVSGRAGIEFYKNGSRTNTIYKPDGLDDLRVYMDNISSDVITFATNGNIGWGTNTLPSSAFDITSSNTFGQLFLGNSVQNRKLVLYDTNGNNHQYYGFGIDYGTLRYQVDTTEVSHVFYAGASASSSNELMRIRGDGNVGIGTTAPQFKLHVNGDIALPYGNAIRAGLGSGIWFASKLMEVVYTGARDQTRIYAPGNNSGCDTPKITIQNDGYVGINTASPAKILDVQGFASFGYSTGGSLATSLILTNHSVTTGSAAGINMGQGSQYTRMYTTNVGANTNRFDLDMTGNSATYSNMITAVNSSGNIYVGILNTSPQYALDVAGHINVNGFATKLLWYGYLNSSGAIGTAGVSPQPYSVYASDWFAAAQFEAYSDQRIKTDIEDITDSTALETIRAIQPKRYTYVDKVSKGNTPVWGFIAQQVGSVLEYSTKQIEQYIPNVYKRVTVTDGNILSAESLDTSVLDSTKSDDNKIHLRIYIEQEDYEKMLEVTVKQIKSATEIEIEEQLDVSEAFVFGQKVNDFHTLNKDAIFTVSVAALQEVDRNLQTAKERLANKDPVLDTMEQQVQDILTRLQNANL